jgi:hypothetical protein
VKPQLTVSGEAVRLPLSDYVAPLLDSLAVAYADDPNTIGRLLNLHAASVLAVDHAAVSDDATDWERAMRAAQADASLEELLGTVNAADDLDQTITADEAVTLSTRLMRLVACIRRTTPKKAS